MRKALLGFLLSSVVISMTACAFIPNLSGKKKAKIEDLAGIMEDGDLLEKVVKEYKLEEIKSGYRGSDPDIEIEVGDDGLLSRLEISSGGVFFSGVEVGEIFDVDAIDEKMNDFSPDTQYSLENGAVYIADDTREDWIVFIQSKKNSDEVNRIIASIDSDDFREELAKRAGLVETASEVQSSETTVATTVTDLNPPTTAANISPTIVVQETVVVPETVYVQVPVYANSGGTDSSYLIPDSSARYLSDAEVNAMSQDFARYALNEIYARHGRLFNDDELQNYFNSKSWYIGTIHPDNFRESSLNAMEKANVKKLDKRRDGQFLP